MIMIITAAVPLPTPKGQLIGYQGIIIPFLPLLGLLLHLKVTLLIIFLKRQNQKADEQSLRLADGMEAECPSLKVAGAIAKRSNESPLMRVDTISRFVKFQTNKLKLLRLLWQQQLRLSCRMPSWYLVGYFYSEAHVYVIVIVAYYLHCQQCQCSQALHPHFSIQKILRCCPHLAVFHLNRPLSCC